MKNQFIDLVFSLIRNVSVFMIVAYLLTRLPSLNDLLNRRNRWVNRLLLIAGFGIFSIYGTLNGIELFGAMANFRDLGPTIAGLLAGPLVGVAAGAIGAIHRYLMGGFTAVPCAAATLLAGIAGGIVHRYKKGREIRVWEATLLMAAIELGHMGITLLICDFSEQAVHLVAAVILPMIAANGAGIAVFFLMINNLTRERRIEAERNRIEGELNVARDIQMSMAPKSLAASREHPTLEIEALLKPAREVGGDLYNYFWIDEERLCLAVGDVAGKGVPASLYMAITQKLIRAAAKGRNSPAALVARLNEELSEGNDSVMFVTLFLGYFHSRTGEFVYSSGGHNPPYLVSPGEVRMLPLEPAMALGVAEEAPYRDQVLQLQAGETLFLYTDGVTEAMNARGELYSEARLERVLKELPTLKAAPLCQAVLKDLARFVGPNEQSDDITMVALHYLGPAGAEEPPGRSPPRPGDGTCVENGLPVFHRS